ncbi:MAG: class I SAM-dependent methyltransferase [Parasporobacterium sp.]|nr:class I SAM-dependent methyltransferase [Parasporobacterium sp.]
MGFRITSMLTIEYARKEYGADLSETVTLGRQFRAFTKKEFRKYLPQYGSVPESVLDEDFKSPYAEDVFYDMYGYKLKSLDGFTHEHPDIVWDLNEPIPEEMEESASCIIDGGTMEHVFHVPELLRNCFRMLKPGGIYISMVPTNNFNGHGLYQFSPDFFYSVFAPQNGMELKDVFIVKFSAKNKVWKINTTTADAAQRLQFDVNTQTEIYVIAQKTGKIPDRLKAQQTDYSEGWYEDEKSITNTASRDALIEKAPRGLVYAFRQFIYEPIVRRKTRTVIKL